MLSNNENEINLLSSTKINQSSVNNTPIDIRSRPQKINSQTVTGTTASEEEEEELNSFISSVSSNSSSFKSISRSSSCSSLSGLNSSNHQLLDDSNNHNYTDLIVPKISSSLGVLNWSQVKKLGKHHITTKSYLFL